MTLQEAPQVVIHAGAVVLDYGAIVLGTSDQFRIGYMDRRRAQTGESPIEPVYADSRPRQTQHEELFGENQPDNRTVHSHTSHAPTGGAR